MRRSYYIMIGGAMVCLALGVFWFVPRSPLLSGLAEYMYPGVLPASAWARNLDSADADLVRESLFFLTKRKDPIAASRAAELLKQSDDYIWLNAALYLGACGRQEATPYLIKTLRYTAWRSDAEKGRYLTALTGADFGTNFTQWQQWWLMANPDPFFDWDSHLGPASGLAEKPKQ